MRTPHSRLTGTPGLTPGDYPLKALTPPCVRTGTAHPAPAWLVHPCQERWTRAEITPFADSTSRPAVVPVLAGGCPQLGTPGQIVQLVGVGSQIEQHFLLVRTPREGSTCGSPSAPSGRGPLLQAVPVPWRSPDRSHRKPPAAAGKPGLGRPAADSPPEASLACSLMPAAASSVGARSTVLTRPAWVPGLASSSQAIRIGVLTALLEGGVLAAHRQVAILRVHDVAVVDHKDD